jgi:L-lactate dehydrogenase complex protein LldG
VAGAEEGGEVMAGAAREAILDRLRTAQRTARLPAPAVPSRLRAWEAASRPRPIDECVERFRRELFALGVESHLEGTDEGVRAQVAGLVEGRRVLSWDPDRLPYGVGTILSGATLAKAPREEQAAAEIGVTGCEAAVAETGSVVVLSGPGRSRAVSLLPPVHLAVVRREQILFSMGEFFRTRAARLGDVSACTFITGPSRTADIELTLTLGVHGPGQVLVVIGP